MRARHVSRHPAKFSGHMHSDSGNIMVLVCHKVSQDHVIKELMRHYGWEPLMVSV